MVAGFGFRAEAAGVVVAAQFVVAGGGVVEQVPGDDEDGSGDGDEGLPAFTSGRKGWGLYLFDGLRSGFGPSPVSSLPLIAARTADGWAGQESTGVDRVATP